MSCMLGILWGFYFTTVLLSPGNLISTFLWGWVWSILPLRFTFLYLWSSLWVTLLFSLCNDPGPQGSLEVSLSVSMNLIQNHFSFLEPLFVVMFSLGTTFFSGILLLPLDRFEIWLEVVIMQLFANIVYSGPQHLTPKSKQI